MSDPPQFDHGKASTLIEQLNSAIYVLQSQTNDRVKNARKMQQNWKGHHADQFFGTEVPRIQDQTAVLVAHMTDIITAVRGAEQAASAAMTLWQRQQPQPTPAPPGRVPTPPPHPGG